MDKAKGSRNSGCWDGAMSSQVSFVHGHPEGTARRGIPLDPLPMFLLCHPFPIRFIISLDTLPFREGSNLRSNPADPDAY